MGTSTRLARVVGTWVALVTACAAPLFVLTWERRSDNNASFQIGKVLGVAIWIGVMAGLDAWLLRRGRDRASRALILGALAFAVIQGIAAIASASAFIYFYMPAAAMVQILPRFVTRVSYFGAAFSFTLACGLIAFFGVMLLAAVCFNVLGRRLAIDEASGRSQW